MHRIVEAFFDELVIGCNIEALSYAYNRKLPIIFTRTVRPYAPFSINVKPETKKYNKLLFMLASKSLTPFSGLLNSIRIEDDNTIKASTNSNVVVIIKFNKLVIADDYKVEGLPAPVSKTSHENHIYDFFQLRTIKAAKKRYFYIENDNLKYVRFFTKKKHTKKIRMCMVHLVVEDDKLNEFEYSVHSVGLYLKKRLKEYGLMGRWDSTNKMFKVPTATFVKRDIVSNSKNIYSDLPDNMKFIYDEEETAIDDKNMKEHYLCLMRS